MAELKYNLYDMGFSRLITRELPLDLPGELNSASVLGNIFMGGSPTNLSSGELIGNLTIKDGYIQSGNYEEGVSGWRLTPTTVQLPDLTLVGNVEIGNLDTYYLKFDGTNLDVVARNTDFSTVKAGSLEQDAGVDKSWFRAIDTGTNWGKRTADSYVAWLNLRYAPATGEEYIRFNIPENYLGINIIASQDFGNMMLVLDGTVNSGFGGLPLQIKNVTTGGRGDIELTNKSSDPTGGVIGELCVVNGILKICTNATGPVWTVVGTQT